MELALPKGAMFVLFVLSFAVCCRLMDSLCPLHVQCACLTDDHLMEKSPLCGLPPGHCKTYNAAATAAHLNTDDLNNDMYRRYRALCLQCKMYDE